VKVEKEQAALATIREPMQHCILPSHRHHSEGPTWYHP
jgi:hypothetical protein